MGSARGLIQEWRRPPGGYLPNGVRATSPVGECEGCSGRVQCTCARPPQCPRACSGGCMNGQVCLWNISAAQQAVKVCPRPHRHQPLVQENGAFLRQCQFPTPRTALQPPTCILLAICGAMQPHRARGALQLRGGRRFEPVRIGGGGTWAAQKHSEAGYGRPVDRGVWTAKTVKRPRQQPAHPQYANYWAPLTRKRHTIPHSAQPRHTNYWAPRTRKRHQQEHRPQRPTDRPGPCKGATTRRNVT